MAPGFLLLVLPLGAAGWLPPPEQAHRDPAGFTWTVDLPRSASLVVNAPVAVVETVLPLPLRLHSTNTTDTLVVKVCEAAECLLPREVSVPPGVTVEVDALFANRAPRLRVVTDHGGAECCDRGLAWGRAVAFAGPAPRSFAFPNANGVVSVPNGLLTVDVGTFLQQRPDLLTGFGAVLFDDGEAPRSLAEPLRRYVGAGGVVSLRADDALALGLVDAHTATVLLAMGMVPTEGDQVVMNVDGRAVRLRTAPDRVAHVGAGFVILREAGRDEEVRLSQVALADASFFNKTPQLDPRNAPLIGITAAGLSAQTAVWPAFALALLSVLGIGVALRRGLQKGTVAVAARNAVVVGVVGAGALIGLRIAVTADSHIALAHWSSGEGGRRVVNAWARAPSSFGDVDLRGAPWAMPPTLTTLVGERTWNSVVKVDGDRVHAQLSSSTGLVGVWFTTDDTPGGLTVLSDQGGEELLKNTLPFELDYVFLPPGSGGGWNRVAQHVAPGAIIRGGSVGAREHFGSVIEERLARDVANACGQCVVGIATVNGVLTAIEASR